MFSASVCTLISTVSCTINLCQDERRGCAQDWLLDSVTLFCHKLFIKSVLVPSSKIGILLRFCYNTSSLGIKHRFYRRITLHNIGHGRLNRATPKCVSLIFCAWFLISFQTKIAWTQLSWSLLLIVHDGESSKLEIQYINWSSNSVHVGIEGERPTG